MGDEQGDSSALMNGLVESMNGSAGDLSEPPSETVTPPRGAFLGVCSKKLFQGWAFKELIALCRLAVPIILTFIFQQLPVILSLFFVGHITGQALELDSAALAAAFTNITGIAVGVGLASAGDTLCSQTYGSKNYKRVGHIFQRGVLILFVVCLFIWCVWLNTESLLLLFQQPPCVTRFTGLYVQIYSISLPAIFVYIMLQKYLQAQSIVWPFIFMSIATNIVSVIAHAILIYGARIGLIGAALALVIANFCQPLFLILYVWGRKLHKQTWDGWSWESLREWWPFLKLGIPGIVMICVEWISFEIGALVVGSINKIHLATNAIVMQIITLAFGIPLGFATAVSVRVGNELGAGQPQKAKRSAYISVALTSSTAVLVSIFLQSTKSVISKLFTDDEEVLEQMPLLLNVLSVIILTDHIQGVIAGVLRGSGRQLLGAGINVVCYYVFGLPVGISLALATEKFEGTLGIWIGLGIASFTQLVGLSIAMIFTNWKKEAKRASECAKSKDEVREQDTDSISSNSTVSEELTMRETALLSEEAEPEDSELAEPQDSELVEPEENFNIDITEKKSIETDKFLVEERVTRVRKRSLVCCQYPRTRVGLLLCRGSLFVVGAALVIGAGVSSQYHPPVGRGNYSECSSNTSGYEEDDLISSTTASLHSETSIIPLPTVSPVQPSLTLSTIHVSPTVLPYPI